MAVVLPFAAGPSLLLLPLLSPLPRLAPPHHPRLPALPLLPCIFSPAAMNLTAGMKGLSLGDAQQPSHGRIASAHASPVGGAAAAAEPPGMRTPLGGGGAATPRPSGGLGASPAGSVVFAPGVSGGGGSAAATVFPSHVRRALRRRPTDVTGELVRLLDDLSTCTHTLSKYVSEVTNAHVQIHKPRRSDAHGGRDGGGEGGGGGQGVGRGPDATGAGGGGGGGDSIDGGGGEHPDGGGDDPGCSSVSMHALVGCGDPQSALDDVADLAGADGEAEGEFGGRLVEPEGEEHDDEEEEAAARHARTAGAMAGGLSGLARAAAAAAGGGGEGGGRPASAPMASHPPVLSSEFATQLLWRSLSHDGYACIMLEASIETPLVFPPDVPTGAYCVFLSALDFDDAAGQREQGVVGTIWSVYKRKSPTGTRGRYVDLQQQAADQVAAGCCVYSSATTLMYTLGEGEAGLGPPGVYSFVLHPVATQYFLQSTHRFRLDDPSPVVLPARPGAASDDDDDADAQRRPRRCGGVYGSRRLIARSRSPLARALNRYVAASGSSCYSHGTLVADAHAALMTRGVVVAPSTELLCEAAPLALLVEHAGGTATDGYGRRVLEMGVTDDAHLTTGFLAGPADVVDVIEKLVAEEMRRDETDG